MIIIKLGIIKKGNKMLRLIILSIFFALSLSEDFTLEDLNTSSPSFGQEVGPSSFPNEVSLVYFGHYN